MAALTCDICGGNLAMNESGDFAVCESCGMKHTKERVKVKVQEIKGVVEVTKGEAEKERLLKNAETFLLLADIPKALEIYKQIANDYPDEVRSWMGIAECCFLRLPKQYEESELTKAGTEISSIYFELLEAQKKAVILDATCQKEFDALWKKHQEKVESYTLELIARYHNNDCLEDVLLELVKPTCYIPMSKQKLLSELKNNASRLENKIYNKQCLNRINDIGVDCIKSYIDSVYGIKNIVRAGVEHIEYLAPQEAVVSTSTRYRDKYTYIRFKQSYTIEELLYAIHNPTPEEKKQIEGLELLKSFLENIPSISDYILKERYKPRENDYSKTTYAVYNVKMTYNFNVTNGELFFKATYNYTENKFDKRDKETRYGVCKSDEMNFTIDKLESIKTFCKENHLCSYCGGEFKGVFKKVCSKCGKPKDY